MNLSTTISETFCNGLDFEVVYKNILKTHKFLV